MKCVNIRIGNDHLHVEIDDGRIISTPIEWYPSLANASESERSNYKLIARGTMIEWQSLDLHLDIEEMFKMRREEKAA